MNTKLFLIVMMTFSIFSVGLVNAMNEEETIKNKKCFTYLKQQERNKQIRNYVAKAKQAFALQQQFMEQYTQCEQYKKNTQQESSGFWVWHYDPCVAATNTRIKLETEYETMAALFQNLKDSNEANEFVKAFGQ